MVKKLVQVSDTGVYCSAQVGRLLGGFVEYSFQREGQLMHGLSILCCGGCPGCVG